MKFQSQYKLHNHCKILNIPQTSLHPHQQDRDLKHLGKFQNLQDRQISSSIIMFSTQQLHHHHFRSSLTVTDEYERNRCAQSNQVAISPLPIFSHVKISAQKTKRSLTSSGSRARDSATRIWTSRSCECLI